MTQSKISPNGPKYGWKPDAIDPRDRVLKFSAAAQPLALPKRVDLRAFCSPVENQFQIGSCTANSVVGALEYLENKTSERFIDLSRLFVYYNSRDIEGTVNEDSGATLRDTIKALSKYGTCNESDWPYVPEKFTVKPPKNCYDYAVNHTIVEYARIITLNDMLQCLASGFPFVFGFSVYDSFAGPVVAKTGILKLPRATETALGGHAVTAVGYDLERKLILVRNSWGQNWGQNGYFTMPFSYISNPNLANDMWCIKKQA